MKTLVIGASSNTERYSNKAIEKLILYKHDVAAIGAKADSAHGIQWNKEQQPFTNVHTVTMYIGAKHQANYYNYILELKPQRVIFNPGTENAELQNLLATNNIETLEACTLVMLSTGQY